MSNEPRKPEAGATPPERPAPAGPSGKAESADVHVEEQLDEALEETFPSSDPVAVKVTR
jgi:hypothetical protein